LKFGIVSDIHCNAEGLNQALRLMGDVDELLCLGDSVSQTRFSNEVIGQLKARGARMVLGNHDIEWLQRLAENEVEKGVADGDLVAWLAGQPQSIEFEVAGKRLLMVHATPWTWDYVFPGSPEMRRFAQVDADFVLGGHTHARFQGRIGRALVINPGSTGEGSYTPQGRMISCATLDPHSGEVELIAFPEPLLDLG
jgi:putative phosphoesterase